MKKFDVPLTLLAFAGLLSFPIAAMTGKVDIFLYGYPLCFPFMGYMMFWRKS